MKCPDCKKEMGWVGEVMDKNGEIVMRENVVWKCPSCGIEIEDDGEGLGGL